MAKTLSANREAVNIIVTLIIFCSFGMVGVTAENSEIRSIKDLSTADPKRAVRFYYSVPSSRYEEIREALDALRRNPGLREYYANRWKAYSNRANDYNELDQMMVDLVRLRTEWSFKLLGQILFDDREVEMPPGISKSEFNSLLGMSLTSIPNRRSAARALSRARLPGAPPFGSSVETWRAWWKINESHLPGLLDQPPVKPAGKILGEKSGTGVYFPPLSVTPPTTMPASPQSSMDSKAPDDTAADSSWLAWSFAGLVGCVVLGLAGWYWRKSGTRIP